MRIHGDGRQVRDPLHLDDVLDALEHADRHLESLSGRPFNLGGGPEATLSLLELIDLLSALRGERLQLSHGATAQRRAALVRR